LIFYEKSQEDAPTTIEGVIKGLKPVRLNKSY
jgi:hypothetical protein